MLFIVEVILHIQKLSVQLLQSFCLPVIVYGLEVTEPQKSAQQLDQQSCMYNF